MAASTTVPSAEQLPEWKTDLINIALEAKILSFGSFVLKSGRTSPYFVNCGLFSRARSIRAISSAYARTLDTYAQDNKGWGFDVIFGPAYKGIPLCATTCDKLAELDEGRWGDVGYSFNRKEVKDHGEGGLMVGESLKGKKVVIIDDVITAGTAIREAVDIIKAQGGELVGIVVAVDRQEKMPKPKSEAGEESEGERGSAIGEVRRSLGEPVLAVLTLQDLIKSMKELGKEEEVKGMEDYYQKYKPTE